ncbi:MAG: hypothetical protein J6Q17_04200, partial [Clostridia bacterium]|nr:hypothetical protein [Clostridia bacterium]
MRSVFPAAGSLLGVSDRDPHMTRKKQRSAHFLRTLLFLCLLGLNRREFFGRFVEQDGPLGERHLL